MLEFSRMLSKEGTDPFDDYTRETEDIVTTDDSGKIIEEAQDVEFPAAWSELAKRTVTNKYFRRSRTNGEKETSLRDMVTRIVSFVAEAGIKQKYFDKKQAQVFRDELCHLIVQQVVSFNSPTWFNAGVPGVDFPQNSACFINKIEDDMESILNLTKVEGMIFKEGSGSGVNLSPLRGSHERIRGGGKASGPVSFMKGYDAFANVILSGGRTRRAARMVILDIDHPDIEKFINCKAKEEDTVKALVLGGISPKFTDPEGAYAIVKHQSGNNSVMISDDFMKRVQEIMHGYKRDHEWRLINRTNGEVHRTVSVKNLFNQIAEAAHKCGDPGVQFYDTINSAATCKNDGNIVASNPCSEFVFLSESACNLASVNLKKFLKDDAFDTKLFKHAVRILIIAQDILVDASSYPTKGIEKNTHNYRPLGLGYANLGAFLMSNGIPYDSNDGRDLAASITSLLTAQAYLTSAEIAGELGPFSRYEDNKDPMEAVLDMHTLATKKLSADLFDIHRTAASTWRDVMSTGFGKKKKTGFRNAQVTLLAPTGTISWMMDCDTTGIEPDVALKKTKTLVDGSAETYVNQSIDAALQKLGYSEEHRGILLQYVEQHGHLEGSSLDPEHLPVFDCALPLEGQRRKISVDGHLDMVAAVQPFLSGAVSKTFNMDNDARVSDVALTFLKAWERGIKCVTIYRQGSKLSEPYSVNKLLKEVKDSARATRERLPDERDAKTHRFVIQGQRGYLTTGFYPDGRVGEIFIQMAEHGSTITGLLNAFSTACSYLLQYGVPLEVLVNKFRKANFPPAGVTSNGDIPMVSSVISYVFRYLEMKYMNLEIQGASSDDGEIDLSADLCPSCGNPMKRTGTCLQCANCGDSQGVCS